jgi:hypothetical protein
MELQVVLKLAKTATEMVVSNQSGKECRTTMKQAQKAERKLPCSGQQIPPIKTKRCLHAGGLYIGLKP